MKKTLLLTTALGLASASQLMAVDLFITGSTAFRANVYTACQKLYDTGAPASITYGDAAHGGDANNNSKTASWCMTGTVSNNITVLGTTPLTIHGLFTGSIQGMQTVEQGTKLWFATPTTGVYVTNTPTIAFSDCSGTASPYPATGNFSEENVCVQPFVIAKSVGLTSVTNVTWDQLRYGIAAGRIPLSTWTGKPTDHSSYVYVIQRTKDSGTRRVELAESQFGYNAPCVVYLYDNVTNNIFYKPSATAIVGSAGNANANLNWGSGYVSGGNIATELAYNTAANQAFAVLSIGDARSVTGVNWSQVIAFNGLYPTAAGPGISGNTGTNDFTPIAEGLYPLWGYEVIVYPNVDPSSLNADQNLTAAQLGNQSATGTILGVLDAQTLINGGSPLAGSIENEIELSKTAANGATAIRLSDMVSSRQAVGGTITP